jgi:hypothetical protein
MKEKYFAGRQLRELTLHEFTLNLAGFRAHDYYGDGSFYLLDSPGVSLYSFSFFPLTTCFTPSNTLD